MKKSIGRRTMLRGMGVALGLPWLEAMIPSSARGLDTAEEPCSPGRALHAEWSECLQMDAGGKRSRLCVVANA
jgi:hypothetical protein